MSGSVIRHSLLAATALISSLAPLSAQNRTETPLHKNNLKKEIRENTDLITLFAPVKNSSVADQSYIDAGILLVSYYDDDHIVEAQSPDGYPIVRDNEDHFLIRNGAGGYDTLHAGLRIYDKESGYKGVFTYDPKRDLIGIHNAGTNGSSKREMNFAANSIFKRSHPGTYVADDALARGVADLEKRFPEIDRKKTGLHFFGFSAGGPIAYMGMIHAKLNGFKVDGLTLIDPYGLKVTQHKANRTLARASDAPRVMHKTLTEFYLENCNTLTPLGGSFVDRIPPWNLGWDMGQITEVPVPVGAEHDLTSYLKNGGKRSLSIRLNQPFE